MSERALVTLTAQARCATARSRPKAPPAPRARDGDPTLWPLVNEVEGGPVASSPLYLGAEAELRYRRRPSSIATATRFPKCMYPQGRRARSQKSCEASSSPRVWPASTRLPGRPCLCRRALGARSRGEGEAPRCVGRLGLPHPGCAMDVERLGVSRAATSSSRGGGGGERQRVSELRQGLAEPISPSSSSARTARLSKAAGVDVKTLAGKRLQGAGLDRVAECALIHVTHVEQIELFPGRRPRAGTGPRRCQSEPSRFSRKRRPQSQPSDAG